MILTKCVVLICLNDNKQNNTFYSLMLIVNFLIDSLHTHLNDSISVIILHGTSSVPGNPIIVLDQILCNKLCPPSQ